VSISLSNEPLLYVDGRRVTAQGAPSSLRRPIIRSLNDIEPDDIESIENREGTRRGDHYGRRPRASFQIITNGPAGSGKFSQTLDRRLQLDR